MWQGWITSSVTSSVNPKTAGSHLQVAPFQRKYHWPTITCAYQVLQEFCPLAWFSWVSLFVHPIAEHDLTISENCHTLFATRFKLTMQLWCHLKVLYDSELHESFITKYLFRNRIQKITKVFCHESFELATYMVVAWASLPPMYRKFPYFFYTSSLRYFKHSTKMFEYLSVRIRLEF